MPNQKQSRHKIFIRILRRTLIGAILVIYGIYTAYFYAFQRDFFFPAQSRPIQIHDPTTVEGLVAARFTTSLGPEAGFGWYLEPPESSYPAPAVIIGHGNGDLADDMVEFAMPLREKGYGVLIVEYPGYGHAVGAPSKASISEAAISGYDWLIEQPGINPNHIVVFGLSLGGTATLEIADKRPTNGAIMLSIFASARHLARDRWLPGFLAKDKFDNLAIVENYNQPIYFMHGSSDLVVFPHHAEKLHQAAPNGELDMLECGHGGCIGDLASFWNRIEPIIQEFNNS